MAGYRVEFCDLLTDQTIYTTADVDQLKFGRRIADSDEISGSVTVTSDNAAQLKDVIAERTAVYVYRGMDIVAGGVVWKADPKWEKRGNAETLVFTGATFESYPHQVAISEDIPAALQVDQLEIARTLMQHMQSDASANLGIQLDPLLSGVLRDRTQYLASANKSYGEALGELGKVQGGFEWTIDCWRDSGTGLRMKRLRFGYPRLGSASAVHVVSRDDLEDWSETGILIGTRYRARGGTPQGNGTAEQQPCMSAVYPANELLGAGWPRIDIVTDYPNVTGDANLNALAARDLADGLKAQVIPQVTLNLANYKLSPQAIGETVRIRLRTKLRGLVDVRYRLTGIQVTAPRRGTLGDAKLTLEAL